MLPGAKKFNFFCHFKVNNSIFNKFDININIDIPAMSISKSISISIWEKSLFRTNIDINIDIFDIETDILLHKDCKERPAEVKNYNFYGHSIDNISAFHISISISISICQQHLFRNQYRYQYSHDGNSNSIPISISIFSKNFDINTNIHFEPISIVHPWSEVLVHAVITNSERPITNAFLD